MLALQRTACLLFKYGLSHTGFKVDKGADKGFKEHDEGWTYFLTELAKYCEKRK